MAFYISAQTEHPQACWDWLKFLSEQPSLFTLYSDTHTGLPPRRSTAESSVYGEQVGQVVVVSYQAAVEQGNRLISSFPMMSRPEIIYPLQWFSHAVRDALEGKDAEAALSKAQHKAEIFADCLASKRDLYGEELVQTCIAQTEAVGP